MGFQSLLNKFFRDKNGKVVIFQPPNIPITGWFLCTIAAYFFQGQIKDGLHGLGTAFLFLWAYLEITEGVNYFRRSAGSIVMLYILVKFFA